MFFSPRLCDSQSYKMDGGGGGAAKCDDDNPTVTIVHKYVSKLISWLNIKNVH